MKFSTLTAVLALATLLPSAAQAERIWYEYGIGSVTGGIDLKDQRTLVRKYYLAAVGPDSIEREVVGYAKECIASAVGVGASVFYANPSPEPATRLGAGYGAFKVTLKACFALRPALKTLENKFTLAITNRAKWEPGVRVKFDVNSPATKSYEKLNKWIKERTGIQGDGAKNAEQSLPTIRERAGVSRRY